MSRYSQSTKMYLNYGRKKIKLEIPERALAGFIKPKSEEASADVYEKISHALDHSAGERLEDIAGGERVCVLIDDGTRQEPHREVIDNIAKRLKSADEITYIIATGSHDAKNTENLKIAELIDRSCKRYRIKNYETAINDCFSTDFKYLGKTSFGTKILVNKKAERNKVFVVASDMKVHYFAGYSNPLKNFLPGICAYETIEQNHSLALEENSTYGTHPWHPNKARRENPLAQDILEGMEIITEGCEVFSLVMVTSANKMVWCKSGEIERVTSDGIKKVDMVSSMHVKPANRIVVSPGGYPNDESLYTAQRALELTKNAILDGGEILFLAECENGIAPNNEAKRHFYDELKKPLKEVMKNIRGKYLLYAHKAYKFAELLDKVEKLWVCTGLSKKVVEDIHMHKTEKPQTVLERWLSEDRDERILFFDEANKIAVYKKQ